MFDKIFYINLAHRTDRDKNVREQVKKIFPDEKKMNDILERIDGVYGNKLDIPNLPSDLITDEGKKEAVSKILPLYTPLTKGAIGCALSHRKAYKKIIDDNLNSALILEDDITIDPQFMEKIRTILEKCPSDYDILFLGYHKGSLFYLQGKINDSISKSSMVYGLFGYIVTNKGARKLMNIFPITKQIDTEISLHFREPVAKNLSEFINDKIYSKYIIPKESKKHKSTYYSTSESELISIDKTSEEKGGEDKFIINAYIVNPYHRLIFSDESNAATRFGTDIQVREPFDNINENKDTLINIVCMLLIASIVYLIVMLI